MIGEEVLIEIDRTLDRLIQNAEALQRVEIQDLSEVEIEAFQKTQESLLQHLVHMDRVLSTKKAALGIMQEKRSARSRIQAKRSAFEKLNTSCRANLAQATSCKTTIQAKRRRKRVFV